MGLRLTPGDPEVEAVLALALERAALTAALRHDGDPSAWRSTALAEAVERDPGRDAYALSPRSTRGATRA